MVNYASVLSSQAATPAAGFALQNGFPNVLTWTAPADGKNHRFIVMGQVACTSAATGGQINMTFTDPAGNSHTVTLASANLANGQAQSAEFQGNGIYIIQSGSTVTIFQESVLSAGAVTAWYEIWGS